MTMHIAMANNYYYLKGGAERVMLEEKKMLEGFDHRVSVFAQSHPRNESMEFNDYYPPFKDWRHVSCLQKVPMALSLMYDRKASRRFDRFLSATGCDILHAHNIYGGLTTSILDVAQKKGIPVVMTLHDYKLICPSYLMLNRGAICEACRGGRFVHCMFKTCHKESFVASGVYCMESYLNKWLQKYDTVRYFICPSMFSLSKHAAHGIARDRLLHIHNFADFKKHEPKYEDGKYVLFVGRLSKEKGVLTLLSAVKNLNVPVRIVGDGPLKAEFECFTRTNAMNHVVFEGYKSGDDLKRLYENAAFLVMPSAWYENAPMTILEAYSYGKPVVGSRIGGIPEMVEHGRTGMLFEMEDSDQLAECVLSLWSDKTLCRDMAHAAHDRLIKEFSPESHYEHLTQVYRSLLE